MPALDDLQDELSKLLDPTFPGFVGLPPDMATFAAGWSNAYLIFAVQGLCGVLPMVPATALIAKDNMTAMLLTFPTFSTGTPVIAADVMTTAVEAFWNTAQLFGPTAVYVPLSAKVVMKPLLEAEFAVLSPDAHAKVLSIASKFYLGSRAAAFVIAGTPPPVTVTWI